jgi:hypothetical protein
MIVRAETGNRFRLTNRNRCAPACPGTLATGRDGKEGRR